MSNANLERSTKINAFVDAIKIVDYCGSDTYPAGLLDWVPPVEDGWTVREHVAHLMDADIHAFARFGFAIAETGTPIAVWDEEVWKKDLNYARHSVKDSLQILHLLRSVLAIRLNALDDAAWHKAQCVHPQRGILTLDALLEIYTGHVKTHLDYIKRNEHLWEKAHPVKR